MHFRKASIGDQAGSAFARAALISDLHPVIPAGPRQDAKEASESLGAVRSCRSTLNAVETGVQLPKTRSQALFVAIAKIH